MQVNHLEDLRARIETDLDHVFKQERTHVGASDSTRTFMQECLSATEYPIKAGGKRVRPLLVQLFAHAVGGSNAFEAARAAATSLELVHTYSLVHDDLPCMDNDDFRRGKPTTHKIYGEAKALLVGDGLLTKAFEILTCPPPSESHTARKSNPQLASELVRILAQCAGAEGMVLGQWLDLSYSNSSAAALWADLEVIHHNKTGMLLAACCEMGFLCGWDHVNAGKEDLTSPEVDLLRIHARTAGIATGLAFQIIDDILDVTESSATLGKTAGKDTEQSKLTAVALLGLDGARSRADGYVTEANRALDALFSGVNEALPPGAVKSECDFWQRMTEDVLQGLLTRKF